MPNNFPQPYDDTIDSRDVESAIDDIERWIDDDTADQDDREALELLTALRDEAKPYAPDWDSGVTLIRYSYFQSYAEQLAEDTGLINDDHKWPLNCIDWDKAADELKMDYTEVEFDGISYYVRS